MRRVRGAWRVLDEDRLGRVGLVNPRHVVDGVVSHRGDEVPGARRFAEEGIDLRRVAEQVRFPLVGVATDETVEVLEAHAARPLVEGAGLAGLERRHVVVLAEPRSAVAIVDQHAADGRLVLADDAVVAGEAGRLFGDDTEAGRVVVTPGDQRSARRRAQRGREDAVVAQAFTGDAVHRRCRDDAAEGARHAKAGVVGDDQQHVGRALGRHHARRPPRLRLQRVVLDDPAELGIGRRQLPVADGGRGARRAQCAGDLLRHARPGDGCGQQRRNGKNQISTVYFHFMPPESQVWGPNRRCSLASTGTRQTQVGDEFVVLPVMHDARIRSVVRITWRATAGHSSKPVELPVTPR